MPEKLKLPIPVLIPVLLIVPLLLGGCTPNGWDVQINLDPPPGLDSPSSGLYVSVQHELAELKVVQNVVYSTRPNPNRDQYTSERTKQAEMQQSSLPLHMDVIVPPNATDAKRQPLLIFMHGGGFTAGSKEDSTKKVETFAQAGYVVANLNYRLTHQRQLSPERNLYAIQSALEDVQNAIRYLKVNAAKYHIDATRISTLGGSAGGALSLLNAAEFDFSALKSDYPGVSSRVDAAMSTGASLVNPDADSHAKLLKFDAADTPVMLFHARETDSGSGNTWQGSALPTCQKFQAVGVACFAVPQPNMTHAVIINPTTEYWPYAKGFLWENLRLAELLP